MAMVECPSISETILGLTFRESKSVAHVCLRSWKRIDGRSARLSRALRERLRRLEGLTMPPTSLANTRPPGRYREPTRSISSSCRVRCPLRASTAPSVSPTARRLFFVLGGPTETLPPSLVSVWETRSRASSKVYIFPPQGQELTLSQAGGDRQHVKGFEAVAAGCVQKRAGLVGGERPDLLLLALGQFDALGGVAGYQAVGDRLIEGFL